MLLVTVVGRRAWGPTAVKASYNIEEVPYEECQTVRASVGLGGGVVSFLMWSDTFVSTSTASVPTASSLAITPWSAPTLLFVAGVPPLTPPRSIPAPPPPVATRAAYAGTPRLSAPAVPVPTTHTPPSEPNAPFQNPTRWMRKMTRCRGLPHPDCAMRALHTILSGELCLPLRLTVTGTLGPSDWPGIAPGGTWNVVAWE